MDLKNDKQATLFLIVGNSGSGKDSIIENIQKIWPYDKVSLRVAKRYITRLPNKSETNNFVEPETFFKLKQEGKFFLTWSSYGLNYGIENEILSWLSQGTNALANVSRTVITQAREKCSSIKVIFISVPLKTTIARLKKRHRECINGDEFNMRTLRAMENQNCSDADFIIENSGPLDQSVKTLLKYMLSAV